MRFTLSKGWWRDLLAVLAVASCGSFLAIWRMNSFFDPFDTSGFIDLFYRIYSGQRLYADFFYNAGPVHPYIGATFFRIFGPGKNAIYANGCMLSLFMAAYSYRAAKAEFGILSSTILAAFATLYFVGPIGFPLYDHHAWVFLLVAVAFLRRDFSSNVVLDASLRGLLCGAMLAFSVLAKSNIGAFGGLVVAGVLMLLPNAGRAIFWLGLSFLLCINVIFFVLDTPFEFFHTNFVEYATVSRLGRWREGISLIHDVPYVMVALSGLTVALLGGANYVRRERRDFVILAGLLATSVFATWTASMSWDLNVFVLGFEIVLLLLVVRRLPSGEPLSVENRIHRVSFVMVSVLAGIMAITGIERSGHLAFFKDRLPVISNIDYRIRSAPMAGWACHRYFCEGMDDTVDYLRKQVPQKDSLFVFPDLTIIYMLTGHESYPGAPYQFLLNTLPAPGKATISFLNRFSEHPPKWIVLHTVSYLPTLAVDSGLQLRSLLLDKYIDSNYRQVWSDKSKEFSVYLRKTRESSRR